jgi:iron-sulfur cluster assembly protein
MLDDDQHLELTRAAAEHLERQLTRRGHGLGLRLEIRRTGCSGFSYVVDYADEIGPEDHVFVSHGRTVVASAKSWPLLRGTVVDFVGNGLNTVWLFKNPNVKSECGCGESFSV